MARAPIDQARPGRDEIWTAIRRLSPATFTAARLADESRANNRTVRSFCQALTAAGYLRQVPVEDGQPATWALVRDIGVEAPRVRPDGTAARQGEVTEQLWRGMVLLKKFTFRDLIETASIEIPETTARSYCKTLLATGYLRVLSKADPSKGVVARYLLIRDNGPKPPRIQRVKQVFDPNTREVFLPGARS